MNSRVGLQASWVKVLESARLMLRLSGVDLFSYMVPWPFRRFRSSCCLWYNVNQPKLWLYNGEWCFHRLGLDNALASERIRSFSLWRPRNLIGRFPMELNFVPSKYKATMSLGTTKRLKLTLRVDWGYHAISLGIFIQWVSAISYLLFWQKRLTSTSPFDRYTHLNHAFEFGSPFI